MMRDCVRVVQRRQRLVEQQDHGIGDERSRQRRALALAAGDVGRPAIEEVRDAERRRDARAPARRRSATGTRRQTVGDVRADRQVREQRELLEHVTDRRRCGRHVDAARRVEERTRSPMAIVPESGRGQTGHAAQQRGLPRAGGAEQDGDAGRRREGHVERERRRQARCGWRPTALMRAAPPPTAAAGSAVDDRRAPGTRTASSTSAVRLAAPYSSACT